MAEDVMPGNAQLDELFYEGITETIVTTLSQGGVPNAAPMGIVRQGDRLFIRMFKDNRTYQNVAETGSLVINAVTDPVVFVVSAFEDLDRSFFVPQQDMPPLIRDAWAWAYCKACVNGVVALSPKRWEILRRTVPRYSRGFSAVIDATITGTRLKYLGEKGVKRIGEDADIAARCGTPRDKEAIQRLQEILGL